MIYYLLDAAKVHGWKIFSVFGYTSTRMILAALTALLFSIICGPFLINLLYSLKIGQPIRMEECPMLGQLHSKKKDTPTMGGALILASMLLALFFWMDLKSAFTVILVVVTLALGFLGAYDDYMKLKYKNAKGISAKKKMGIQIGVAGLVALYLFSTPLQDFLYENLSLRPPYAKEVVEKIDESGLAAKAVKSLSLADYSKRLYIPFLKEPLIFTSFLAALLMGVFSCIVIAGSSNAVNLTDGLDGLASGCLILVAGTLALFAFISNHSDLAAYLNILYIHDSSEIAVYLSAFVGACLGFLWYNGHPAQIFMGDTGSLALGGIIGVVAVLLKRELLLALIGGIFVVEALSVIVQVLSFRYRNKKRVFLCAPLHHHFEYKGFAESKVVIRFWIVGLLLALIGVASLKFQ